MRALPRSRSVVVVIAVTFLLAGNADAQLGGLIKKKVNQAAANAQAEPVKFDDVILEITADRVNKFLAARQAARQFAQGPTGPQAYHDKIAPLDSRQVAIYSKEVDNINNWDAKRMAHERCLDSAFTALRDKRQAQMTPQSMNDPAMQKMMQTAQQVAMAQARGDTATVRKLYAQLELMKQPTKADTAAAQLACGPVPAPSAIIKQWLDLKAQIDSLSKLKAAADDSLYKMDQRLGGMNPRQAAVFCERIKVYVEALKKKQKLQGPFTDDEIKTMAGMAQAIKDLEALCP